MSARELAQRLARLHINSTLQHPKKTIMLNIYLVLFYQVNRLQDFRRLNRELLLDVLDNIAEYISTSHNNDLIIYAPQVENIEPRDAKFSQIPRVDARFIPLKRGIVAVARFCAQTLAMPLWQFAVCYLESTVQNIVASQPQYLLCVSFVVSLSFKLLTWSVNSR